MHQTAAQNMHLGEVKFITSVGSSLTLCIKTIQKQKNKVKKCFHTTDFFAIFIILPPLMEKCILRIIPNEKKLSATNKLFMKEK